MLSRIIWAWYTLFMTSAELQRAIYDIVVTCAVPISVTELIARLRQAHSTMNMVDDFAVRSNVLLMLGCDVIRSTTRSFLFVPPCD